MINRTPKLVIVSERTRNHFQDPLRFFSKFDVTHLYKNTYPDFKLKYKSNINKFNSVFDLWRELKKNNPDFIQTYEPYYGYSKFCIPIKPLLILGTVYLFSLFRHKPYYYNALEVIEPEIKYGYFAGKIMESINYLYAKRAKLIFTMTDGAHSLLIGQGIKSEKIINNMMIGHWGVETDIFKPYKKKKTKNHRLIFIGSLNEQKGSQYIISIHNEVRKSFPDLETVIVGEGSFKQAIEAQSQNTGQNIHFLGNIKNEKIPEELNKSSVIIAPYITTKSSAEQTCGSLLEAMACGLPIIAFSSGGIPRYITDKRNGFLIKEGNLNEFVNKINRILRDNPLRKKIQENNINDVKDRFNAKTNVLKLESILLKLDLNNDQE